MREVTVIIRLLITKVSIREDEVELFTNYQRECSRLYTSPAHSTVHTSILSWRLRFQSLKFLSGQLVSQKKKNKRKFMYIPVVNLYSSFPLSRALRLGLMRLVSQSVSAINSDSMSSLSVSMSRCGSRGPSTEGCR